LVEGKNYNLLLITVDFSHAPIHLNQAWMLDWKTLQSSISF